ncbi:unnamed protein product [Protopolystoma xenopodis]|uniref:Uncharacterized protein n=1 Tax=Protopolystoma xenopodis TaxID=117903 RepID=A0A448WWB3_9PLAT|nr:unnamed protein product [Protopolystoma xenopodis]
MLLHTGVPGKMDNRDVTGESTSHGQSSRAQAISGTSERRDPSLTECVSRTNYGTCRPMATGHPASAGADFSVDVSNEGGGTGLTDKLLHVSTPLLVSALCQLVVNLLIKIPPFIVGQLEACQLNPMLMSIVDPTLH